MSQLEKKKKSNVWNHITHKPKIIKYPNSLLALLLLFVFDLQMALIIWLDSLFSNVECHFDAMLSEDGTAIQIFIQVQLS